MTERNLVTLIIISAIPFTENAWVLWKDNERYISPWLIQGSYFNITVEWYIRFACKCIADMLTWGAIYRMSRIDQTLRLGAIVYGVYRLQDTIQFFLWFNQKTYLPVLGLLPVIAAIIGYTRVRQRKKDRLEVDRINSITLEQPFKA